MTRRMRFLTTASATVAALALAGSAGATHRGAPDNASCVAQFVQAGVQAGNFGELASFLAHAYDANVYPLGADISVQARSARDSCPFTP